MIERLILIAASSCSKIDAGSIALSLSDYDRRRHRLKMGVILSERL